MSWVSSTTIIRVQALVRKVFPAFRIDGFGLKIEIPHRLYDCKVIGLHRPEAVLLYDRKEASADTAWDKQAWAAQAGHLLMALGNREILSL
jgi:hypothetical protein